MRFKPGQKLICIHPGKWEFDGPDFGETVVCESYQGSCMGHDFIFLEGWDKLYWTGQRINFNDIFFEPLESVSELESILQQETEPCPA